MVEKNREEIISKEYWSGHLPFFIVTVKVGSKDEKELTIEKLWERERRLIFF